ncbi:hypothetical protein [Chryseobacterium sp. MP_3.2]|uniref:hypothetical protein n=1 Tax=Chryseobacterium sp. MP_3.2 TaxID=3071712 RepID=UPI002DFD725A|nr:hypothetical protein [Chryseobacterium sp. MP_3.2]
MLLLTVVSTFVFSQENTLQTKKGIYPLYLMDGIIANESEMKLKDPTQILTISVYKSDQLPEALAGLKNFGKDGIIDLKLKVKNPSDLSAVLKNHNTEQGLPANNPIYVNGVLVKDPTIQILYKAIVEFEITEVDSGKYLNIWTISKEDRNNLVTKRGGVKIQQRDGKDRKTVLLK